MSKSEKELYALRDQQENEILRRVLFWLGAAVILESLVLLGNRYYFHYLTSEIGHLESLMAILQALQYVGILLAVASAAWAYAARKGDASRGIFRVILAALFASISVCSFLFLTAGSASVPLLLVSIPAAAGLIMIYYLYQREFFLSALIAGMGLLGLWLYRAGSARYTSLFYAYTVFIVCVLLFVGLFSLKLKKQKGSFQWKNAMYSMLKPDANYKFVWASCIMVAVLLLSAIILGTTFAYYAFLALVVWIFVMAVYFTSRLM